MKIIIPGNKNIDTGVITPDKEVELILTEPPIIPEGYQLEEWVEKTDTQWIQHYNIIPFIITTS